MEKFKIFEEFFKSQIKKTKYTETKENVYVINLTWDINDDDYVDKTIKIEKNRFEKDFLLQLLLAYINVEKDDEIEEKFPNIFWGYYINEFMDQEDKRIIEFERIISDYISEKTELNVYIEDRKGHSVILESIYFYDSEGEKYDIQLPDITELFESEEQLIETFTQLYKLNL